MYWLLLLLLPVIGYMLAVRGRRNHPGLEKLRGWAYAHRGLHNEGCPENSMAAFRRALAGGYGIELDVHLLADGNLAVIHDSALLRTTGAAGRIEDLTTRQLAQYTLEGTEETIPTFRQVLELFDGKAPMIIELKAEKNNCAALCEATCRELDAYSGVYCLESFDPRCIRWLRKHRPDLIRGQLAQNFMNSKGKQPALLRFLSTWQIWNFWILPDFTAYRFADRKNLGTFLTRKFWGVQGVTWTIKTQEEFDTAIKEDWIPIFEGFTP